MLELVANRSPKSSNICPSIASPPGSPYWRPFSLSHSANKSRISRACFRSGIRQFFAYLNLRELSGVVQSSLKTYTSPKTGSCLNEGFLSSPSDSDPPLCSLHLYMHHHPCAYSGYSAQLMFAMTSERLSQSKFLALRLRDISGTCLTHSSDI